MHNVRFQTRLGAVMATAVSASALFFLCTGLAWAQKAKPRQPVVTTAPQGVAQLAQPLTVPSGSTLTVAPAPSIQATTPGTVFTSGAVTVTFRDSGARASGNQHYSIWLWATGTGTNFTGTGCPTVPISAVTAHCTAGTAPTGGTVACASASFTLPTTEPATGNLVNQSTVGTAVGNYTLTVTYSITDSYQYFSTTGKPCTVTLNYSVQTQ